MDIITVVIVLLSVFICYEQMRKIDGRINHLADLVSKKHHDSDSL